MLGYDAAEGLTPLRDERGDGAILFDQTRVRQARAEWFDPRALGGHAQPVASGGRGSAWFVDAPFGAAVLRHYRRGGLAARISRDRYLFHGPHRTRSFVEFRLLRAAARRGVPVPRPIAAWYRREGWTYRAAILIERIADVRSLADRLADEGAEAPWAEAGRLIARCHRAGLDHADLNAHNLLFDDARRGWVIDLDRSRLRIPETGWRERNLARLRRSLLKVRGARGVDEVLTCWSRLRSAYDQNWSRGY